MLKVTDLRGQTPTTSALRRVLPRGGTDVASVIHIVSPIIDAVKESGARAALDYGEKFDGVRPNAVRVPTDVVEAAVDQLDSEVKAALEEAIHRIRACLLYTSPSPRDS